MVQLFFVYLYRAMNTLWYQSFAFNKTQLFSYYRAMKHILLDFELFQIHTS